MIKHRLFDDVQSAYRPGHSTETAMLKIKMDIDEVLDQGDGVLLVLLDLSAAFDTIDHEILLQRVHQRAGVEGVALQWLRSYLTGRSSGSLFVNNTISREVPLLIGVPQGSVLGPLLFLMYILPLQHICRKHGIHHHGYADDTQLYCRLPLKDTYGVKIAIKKMEACLSEIRLWMLQNKLKLNYSKTECMLFAPRAQVAQLMTYNITVTVGGETIKPQPKVKNPGAYLDTTMSMVPLISSMTRTAYYHLRCISKIRCHLDTNT
eukprot:GHVU01164303.1.p1 GENE.GHVU01164303.1~~GHVU01164303.1.p1  ORF type:complete len:263 (+),score=7.91 GHVU01164303.1:941-1729(+)